MWITRNCVFLLTSQLAALLVPNQMWAQEDTTAKRLLSSEASIKGFVGGESHNGYVIHAAKGQAITVRLSFQPAANHAEFTVSESANFFDGTSVAFGKTTHKGSRWSGIAPTTRDYYVYVVAHPEAHYVLRFEAR